MKAKREYRERDRSEVAILDALVDRGDEGMTVFEIRSHVDIEIDEIETALGNLKDDGLITVGEDGNRAVIVPDDRVIPDPGEDDPKPSLYEEIRRRLPF